MHLYFINPKTSVRKPDFLMKAKHAILFVTMLLSSLLILNCVKEKNPLPSDNYFFHGELDGQLWEGMWDAEIQHKDKLTIWGVHGNKVKNSKGKDVLVADEEIRVEIDHFDGEGIYNIDSGKVVIIQLLGGDVPTGIQASFGSVRDKLKLDQKNDIFEGSIEFDARDSTNIRRFLNGKFRTKL